MRPIFRGNSLFFGSIFESFISLLLCRSLKNTKWIRIEEEKVLLSPLFHRLNRLLPPFLPRVIISSCRTAAMPFTLRPCPIPRRLFKASMRGRTTPDDSIPSIPARMNERASHGRGIVAASAYPITYSSSSSSSSSFFSYYAEEKENEEVEEKTQKTKTNKKKKNNNTSACAALSVPKEREGGERDDDDRQDRDTAPASTPAAVVAVNHSNDDDDGADASGSAPTRSPVPVAITDRLRRYERHLRLFAKTVKALQSELKASKERYALALHRMAEAKRRMPEGSEEQACLKRLFETVEAGREWDGTHRIGKHDARSRAMQVAYNRLVRSHTLDVHMLKRQLRLYKEEVRALRRESERLRSENQVLVSGEVRCGVPLSTEGERWVELQASIKTERASNRLLRARNGELERRLRDLRSAVGYPSPTASEDERGGLGMAIDSSSEEEEEGVEERPPVITCPPPPSLATQLAGAAKRYRVSREEEEEDEEEGATSTSMSEDDPRDSDYSGGEGGRGRNKQQQQQSTNPIKKRRKTTTPKAGGGGGGGNKAAAAAATPGSRVTFITRNANQSSSSSSANTRLAPTVVWSSTTSAVLQSGPILRQTAAQVLASAPNPPMYGLGRIGSAIPSVATLSSMAPSLSSSSSSSSSKRWIRMLEEEEEEEDERRMRANEREKEERDELDLGDDDPLGGLDFLLDVDDTYDMCGLLGEDDYEMVENVGEGAKAGPKQSSRKSRSRRRIRATFGRLSSITENDGPEGEGEEEEEEEEDDDEERMADGH